MFSTSDDNLHCQSLIAAVKVCRDRSEIQVLSINIANVCPNWMFEVMLPLFSARVVQDIKCYQARSTRSH